MSPELRAAINSLLSDIDAMSSGSPDLELHDESDYWFGDFSVSYDTGSDGTFIEWPNLALTAQRVKTLLATEDDDDD